VTVDGSLADDTLEEDERDRGDDDDDQDLEAADDKRPIAFHLAQELGFLFGRALREQIDWEDVRARTAKSPYARAFFCLVEELGIEGPSSERAPTAN